jgi:hypothetical protein
VHVDEAGGDVRAAGVEDASARLLDRRPDLGDPAVGHQHVGRVGGPPVPSRTVPPCRTSRLIAVRLPWAIRAAAAELGVPQAP